MQVEYAPGATDPVHRHDAHVFVYVLEGDVHVVGRNASKTKPVKFLAFFVKNQGAPVLTPAE